MTSPTTTATATVAGMTCGHCVAAVREELSAIPGVTDVDVELTTGAVTVTSAGPIEESVLRDAVEEAGYELVAVARGTS